MWEPSPIWAPPAIAAFGEIWTKSSKKQSWSITAEVLTITWSPITVSILIVALSQIKEPFPIIIELSTMVFLLITLLKLKKKTSLG